MMDTERDTASRTEADRNAAPAATRRPRRFFQFTMAQSLLLLALVSVLMGILTPRIQRAFQLQRLDERGRSLADASKDLLSAVRGNNLSLARRSLTAGADPDLIGINRQVRLLSMCTVNGQLEMMQLLLDFGADVEGTGSFPSPFPGPVVGGPPLFAAAGCDQPPEVRCELIRCLVERGADPRVKVGRFHAMDVAVHLSDGETGDLLRGYGLPYGPREMTAFNRLDELRPAVDNSPDLLSKRFPTTWATRGDEPTLLGIALRRGYREMSLFLIDSGAPLDIREHEGRTLLHEAASGGDPELIRLLVARGLDVNAIDDHFKETALVIATEHDKPEAVAALLAAGADPTIADIQGHTPLDIARSRKPNIAALLEEAIEVANQKGNGR